MAKFQLPGPDGGLYEVDAPDAQSAYDALHSDSAKAAWQGSTGAGAPARNRLLAISIIVGLPLGRQYALGRQWRDAWGFTAYRGGA